MKNNIRYTEQDFFQWVKGQIENREYMCGQRFEKEKMKEELYELLFVEQNLTLEEIERFFVPFGQAGYLSPRRKFEIMLFILEKDYGRPFLFLEGAENRKIITGDDVDAVYLQWLMEERLFMSEEEKKEFFIQTVMDSLGLGVLEILHRIAMEGILIGEFCPALYEQEQIEERLAVCINGCIIWLPFLALDSREEMIQIIKYALAREKKRELTIMEPIVDFVKEDGTCITAVRPPAGKEWGIRILYGAARREKLEWKM